jgi:transposase
MHLDCSSVAHAANHPVSPSQGEAAVCFTWHGSARAEEVVNLGPLALLGPLLERMQVADIIDRHVPPDPQLEFSHGQVLSLLLAARLSCPTALVNVATWAEKTGADLLWNIPADKLNDDRLGRALDAFFDQRHSILGSVAAQVLTTADVLPERLHFDTTHLLFHGAYDTSQPRPDNLPLPPETPSGAFPAAHLTYGYGASDVKLVQAGICAVVDDRGALPVFGHVLDGNRNGHPAIEQQFALLQNYLPLPPDLLMVSDRGTFSAAHVGRLHRHGCHVLCSVPWGDYRALFDQHRAQLHWQRASYLSLEQQRRRDTGSALPREHYELAVVRHELTDPDTQQAVPCRVLFVFSTADAKVCRRTRDQAIAKIRAGLERIAATVQRGHARSNRASIERRVAKLFGNKSARHYFRWELLPLTAAEQAALPPPPPRCRRPRYRFVFHYAASAAEADAVYDGYSALVTTAPLSRSADVLFSQFKQQNYVELLHHQWKTPLAVRPVFLKSPKRVEALVCLLQIALTAYQLLERLYRQRIEPDAPAHMQRMTSESLLRQFRVYGLILSRSPLGRVVYATRLTTGQRNTLDYLGFATPAQTLARKLPHHPSG